MGWLCEREREREREGEREREREREMDREGERETEKERETETEREEIYHLLKDGFYFAFSKLVFTLSNMILHWGWISITRLIRKNICFWLIVF